MESPFKSKAAVVAEPVDRGGCILSCYVISAS
jgi:hypothetical protein